MVRDPQAAERAFSAALQSFDNGFISDEELLAEVSLQLGCGAPQAVLREALFRDGQQPLPRQVHEGIVRLLDEAAGATVGGHAAGDGPPLATAPPSLHAAPAELPTAAATPEEAAFENAAPPTAGDLDEVESSPVGHGDTLLQRFTLVQLIAEGANSRIYKATDSRHDIEPTADPFIAVKVFSQPFTGHSASFDSLQAEVRKLQNLKHPNIVRIFSCERHGATAFITMEFLTGVPLSARLHPVTRESMPRMGIGRDEARTMLTTIAAALDYAHRRHVVHGDLKPANVILAEDGSIKIIDFGMASWSAPRPTAFARREYAHKKTPGATPRYASPQLMLRQAPEPSDDVYALACIAYELYSGYHPFETDTGAPTFKFPPRRRAELTAAQYDAIVHGLQRERAGRTATVRKFMREFAAVERRKLWRSRAGWASAALVALGVGWFFGRSSPSPAPPSPAPRSVAVPAVPATAVKLAPAPLPDPVVSRPEAPVPEGFFQDCPTCPLMAVVPAGRFMQGSAAGTDAVSASSEPRHEVVIARPFALSTRDVTVGDFGAFVLATRRDMKGCDVYDGAWRHRAGASWKAPGFVQLATHPVTCVSWADATAYTEWMSTRTAHRYRLPSASEWEYAARNGGETTRYWAGTAANACAYANVADETAAHRYPGWEVFSCRDGYVYTAPAGSFKANEFGLHDMLGNVLQWTNDCWSASYAGAPGDGSARLDGNCKERELRGGSWFSSPATVTTTYRNHFSALYRTNSVGFRLAREITP